ncbi:hypothetical protein EX30DRAFT_351039 [Ascodesmis nigricans]|uniref:Uncharacterized protein n=1 Tax=Ascodesmis nigricans TaxID=341454 RepID=A0A4V3SI25_9PEZI|nr:hypothetical protein EX30DRAFT_351039 [Ascodesmis nigricans]
MLYPALALLFSSPTWLPHIYPTFEPLATSALLYPTHQHYSLTFHPSYIEYRLLCTLYCGFSAAPVPKCEAMPVAMLDLRPWMELADDSEGDSGKDSTETESSGGSVHVVKMRLKRITECPEHPWWLNLPNSPRAWPRSDTGFFPVSVPVQMKMAKVEEKDKKRPRKMQFLGTFKIWGYDVVIGRLVEGAGEGTGEGTEGK